MPMACGRWQQGSCRVAHITYKESEGTGRDSVWEGWVGHAGLLRQPTEALPGPGWQRCVLILFVTHIRAPSLQINLSHS